MMYTLISLLVISIFLLPCHEVFATSSKPPFATVRIYGKTAKKFNKVSLFKSGSSRKPFKTRSVKSTGAYTLDVSIPQNMRKKGDYYYTDMRFWNDKNNNGIKDDGESISQCHFITWFPSQKQVYMQIYNGPTHQIKSSKFKYNYQ